MLEVGWSCVEEFSEGGLGVWGSWSFWKSRIEVRDIGAVVLFGFDRSSRWDEFGRLDG